MQSIYKKIARSLGELCPEPRFGRIPSQIASIEFMSREYDLPIEGRVVLDAGSGLGTRSMIFALLGAKRVYSVEVDEESVAVLRSNIERWSGREPRLKNIEPVISEVQDFLPAVSPHLIYSNEILSHMDDRQSFYDYCHRVLENKGALFISDSNNGRNARISRSRKSMWRKAEAENGEIYESRKELIRRRLPTLDDSQIQHLTLNTCYKKPHEIDEIVERYLTQGKLEEESRFMEGKAPLDPEHGFLPTESLVEPFETAMQLESMGFEVRLIPYFCGAKRGALKPINRIGKCLPLKLSFRYARTIHISALKTEDSSRLSREIPEGKTPHNGHREII
jgi:SAM-dependent methyltransferase